MARGSFYFDRASMSRRPAPRYNERGSEGGAMRRAHGRRCEPCEGLKGPLGAKEAKALASELKGWRLVGGKTLRQDLVMKDFMSAVRLIDAIARAAEAEGHR